jgi:Astacin (Peptidase family M12A)
VTCVAIVSFRKQEITYYFSDGAENQRRKVSDVIKAWEGCANITFKLVNSLPATVCITFTGPYPYSTPLTDGKTTGKQNLTMCLCGTANNNILTPTEKGNILHEFGHILGLGHEHLSPDMKQKYTLKEAGTLR